jgi:hypothetical protein
LPQYYYSYPFPRLLSYWIWHRFWRTCTMRALQKSYGMRLLRNVSNTQALFHPGDEVGGIRDGTPHATVILTVAAVSGLWRYNCELLTLSS